MSTYIPTNALTKAAAPQAATATYTPTNALLIAAATLPSGIGPGALYIGAVQVGGLWIGAVQPVSITTSTIIYGWEPYFPFKVTNDKLIPIPY